MSQGHAGGHRAPARWTPAALRPQGHSHGVQLSLPLSKVDRSVSLARPCHPGILRSLAGSPTGATLHTQWEEDPLAPQGTPRMRTPGCFPEPLCWATLLFWGAPRALLAGGAQGTCASLLGSPPWSSPRQDVGRGCAAPLFFPYSRAHRSSSSLGSSLGSKASGNCGTVPLHGSSSVHVVHHRRACRWCCQA